MQLLAKLGRGLQQKAAQTLRVGMAGQSRQVLESAVGAQEGRGFQTIQPQNNGINQSQEPLRQLVLLVAARLLQMPGEKTAPWQHSGEFVEKEDASVMGQTRVIKGDSNACRRTSHPDFNLTESEVKVRDSKVTTKPANIEAK